MVLRFPGHVIDSQLVLSSDPSLGDRLSGYIYPADLSFRLGSDLSFCSLVEMTSCSLDRVPCCSVLLLFAVVLFSWCSLLFCSRAVPCCSVPMMCSRDVPFLCYNSVKYRFMVELWDCRIVGLWSCGTVELWDCRVVGLWSCGTVELWDSGIVEQWSCGALEVEDRSRTRLRSCGTGVVHDCGVCTTGVCMTVECV